MPYTSMQPCICMSLYHVIMCIIITTLSAQMLVFDAFHTLSVIDVLLHTLPLYYTI